MCKTLAIAPLGIALSLLAAATTTASTVPSSYRFRVKAFNASGDSAFTRIVDP
jgi:hypothetical protein